MKTFKANIQIRRNKTKRRYVMKCFTVKKVSFSFGNEETVVLNNTVYGRFNDAVAAMKADCDVESRRPVSSNRKVRIDEKRGTAYISDFTRLMSTILLKNMNSCLKISGDGCGFRRLFEHVLGFVLFPAGSHLAEINIWEVFRKMSREEKLCRRLCKCLGFTVKTDNDDMIAIVIPDPDVNGIPFRVRYRSWNDVLFGDFYSFGLCELKENLMASSLDELELQLAARGF